MGTGHIGKIYKLMKKASLIIHSPEHINQYLLKKCATSLALPLSLIFTKTLSTGIVLELWKTAHILPVFKRKGSINGPKNYRPIALTSLVCSL